MKRLLALLLTLAMVLSLAACAAATKPAQDTPTEAADTPTDEPAAPASDAEPATGTPTETPDEDATVIEEPPAWEETEVAAFHNQDAYDGPCVFRPEADGVYKFAATDPSYELELYDPMSIRWTVYVLDAEFEDAWRYLGQANRPAINNLLGEERIALKAGQYVYCVCSTNSFTGDKAEDNVGTLTISSTNRTYGPTAENGYVQPVSVGAYVSWDLDGDGTEDQVFYQVDPAWEDEEGVWNESKVLTFDLNGHDWAGEGDNPMEPYGFWMENPDVDSYYLVDLDPNDNLVELAIADYGSNDYRTTHFFRYEEGTLHYIGWITGFPDDGYTTFHGDNTVSSYSSLDVMQTWGGVVTWQLKDGQMERVKGEMVTPFPYDERMITLKQPLTVYKEPDRSAEQLTLQPSDDPVELPQTDTEHWVQIICADGTGGWAYFEDFHMVENNGTMVDDTEVFDNLLFAG